MKVILRSTRWAGLVGLALLLGCDSVMTEAPTAGDEFSAPFDGMTQDLNSAFVEGDENFERAFTVAEGLGPIFNNIACEGCHPGDGRGTPEMGFFRFSRGSDLAVDIGGPQHQDKAIPGIPLEVVPAGVDRSFRLPPPVFGVGLIEAIPVATITAHADPDDEDGDGISGRPNWEFKFLRRALQEDDEVEVVGLIRIARREPKFDFRSRFGESTNPLFRGFGNQDDETAEQYDQPVLLHRKTFSAATTTFS